MTAVAGTRKLPTITTVGIKLGLAVNSVTTTERTQSSSPLKKTAIQRQRRSAGAAPVGSKLKSALGGVDDAGQEGVGADDVDDGGQGRRRLDREEQAQRDPEDDREDPSHDEHQFSADDAPQCHGDADLDRAGKQRPDDRQYDQYQRRDTRPAPGDEPGGDCEHALDP